MISNKMKKRIQTNRMIALVLCCIVILSIGCGIIKEANNDMDVKRLVVEDAETETETSEEVYRANILAVGDDLIHSGLYKSGMKEDGTRNYDHLYQYVKDEVEAADLAIVNQETILVSDESKFSGYPSFGTPVEFADALVNCGFDVVLHATNHVMDRRADGVHETLEYWKTNYPEITVLGIHENQEDADNIKVVDVNGIRIAMLNYAYGMNGMTLPDNEPYLVDLLDKEKVGQAIAVAKEISDIVVFFGHMGTEYVYEPSEYSKEWVDYLLEQGVDIAINSHPHVLEPYKMLTRDDGHQMLVYYSMGNFISTQDAVPRLLGGMAKIQLEKKVVNGQSEVKVVDYTLEPVVAHWNHNSGEYGTYMLEDYTDELAAKHGIHGVSNETFNVARLKEIFDEIMNTTVNPAQGVLE